MNGLKCRTVIKNVFKILVWIPSIIIAVSIFGFSSQNGGESSGLSRKAAVVIVNTADYFHIIELTSENEQDYIETLQLPIRKGAHMTEYAIFTLSILLALYVWNIRKRLLYIEAFAIAVIFSGTDEIHQLFVSGRSGRFLDVLIDSTGAALGLLVVWCISNLRRKRATKIVKKEK